MISVEELKGISQGNSDSGRERLRLPTASLTIVFSGSIIDLAGVYSYLDRLFTELFVGTKLPQIITLVQK